MWFITTIIHIIERIPIHAYYGWVFLVSILNFWLTFYVYYGIILMSTLSHIDYCNSLTQQMEEKNGRKKKEKNSNFWINRVYWNLNITSNSG